MKNVFAYFDGDNIGNHLELLLLDDRVQEAKVYSESVNCALLQIKTQLENYVTVEVLLSGGDDLVATWPRGALSLECIERIRATFNEICGKSLSVGIGLSVSRAASNLRRAKLMGKSRTIYDHGSWDGTEA